MPAKEFDWEAQRQRSQVQGELLKEVRRRDGACCRVCGLNVSFSVERESPLAINYRILNPGTTLTVDGVVVVCRVHLAEGDVRPVPSRPNWVENMAAAAAQVLAPPPAAPVVVTEAAVPAESKWVPPKFDYWSVVRISAVTALGCIALEWVVTEIFKWVAGR